MLQVYSTATKTFSYTGEESDGGDAALSWLGSRHSTPGALGGPVHTCALPSTLVSKRRSSELPQACAACELESRLEGLRSFFLRPYWKRRWIIQEISVASQVRIICGEVIAELEEIRSLIKRCRDSKYWNANMEEAYTWFNIIMEFRDSYQTNKDLPLLDALSSSKGFQSKDPRDSFFSLLGICCDGQELIPTPNYSQSVEAIQANVTRELIRKHKSLDLFYTTMEE